MCKPILGQDRDYSGWPDPQLVGGNAQKIKNKVILKDNHFSESRGIIRLIIAADVDKCEVTI